MYISVQYIHNILHESNGVFEVPNGTTDNSPPALAVVISQKSLPQGGIDAASRPAQYPSVSTLYYRNDLDLLRRYVSKEAIDLL